MNKRDYLIGDIHGCFDELMILIKKCDTHSQNASNFISCGDLIDRGPKSKEVLDYFIENDDCQAIVGNHEQEFIAIYAHYNPDVLINREIPCWFVSLEESRKIFSEEAKSLDEYASSHFLNWFSQGGVNTLKSLNLDLLDPTNWDLDKRYLDFFFSMKLFIKNENYFLSHALVTKSSFDKLDQINRLSRAEQIEIVNELLWNRSQEDLYKSSDFKMISGHTPFKKGIQYLKSERIIQIDTACCYEGGHLSAWCNDGSIITSL